MLAFQLRHSHPYSKLILPGNWHGKCAKECMRNVSIRLGHRRVPFELYTCHVWNWVFSWKNLPVSCCWLQNLSSPSLTQWLLGKLRFYMGKLPVEPRFNLLDNWTIKMPDTVTRNRNRIAPKSNRGSIPCSRKFSLLRSVLLSFGNLGIREDIVSAAHRISGFTFQSKGLCQKLIWGLSQTILK